MRMYGARFAAMWDGIPVADVKAEWADALQPFYGCQIAWALAQFRSESEWPPTLPAFVRMCANAPKPDVSAPIDRRLTEAPPVDRKRAAEFAANLSRILQKKTAA